MKRAGLLARLLRRPCSVCELHRHHRDPYYRARPACPEWFHRRTLGRRMIATERPTSTPDAVVRVSTTPDTFGTAERRTEA